MADIYVGDDGKIHKVQGGADSVLPFNGYKIQTDSFSFTLKVESVDTKTIVFPEPFDKPPTIYGGYNVKGDTYLSVNNITNVTETGMTIIITNLGNTATDTLKWFAISEE